MVARMSFLKDNKDWEATAKVRVLRDQRVWALYLWCQGLLWQIRECVLPLCIS